MSDLLYPENTSPPEAPPSPADKADVDTCWNRIGVYGDNSCAELTRAVHCRNCAVFSNAAHRLLDRPLPDEYRREWTEHFAQEKKAASPAKLSAVIFRIGSEWLALPTAAFQEVAERRRIHSLPHRRQSTVLGLVNIRGELLVCVSLGRVLGIDRTSERHAARSAYDRLLVSTWEGSRLAFPVDEVKGIHRFQGNELREPPATVAKSGANFSDGILLWRDRPVGFLSPALLFKTLNGSLT